METMAQRRGMVEAEITLDGRPIRYLIRTSVRARRISLRVGPGLGLEVVLPAGQSPREAAQLVQREQAWVLRELARVQHGPSTSFVDGALLPLLGDHVTLRPLPTVSRVAREGAALLVPLSASWAGVEDWYRREARRVLGERAGVHAAALGVSFGRLAVKDTRSRWGSCSSKGNLNFSWRLLLAPYAVMNYVVAHEVAHLRELNHSPRFWAIVEALCPDYRTHRAWLRATGWTLAAWPGEPPRTTET
jgi:predicted metal-dependent hydrolase